MPLSAEVRARILNAVNDKAPNLTCWVCGSNNWQLVDGFVSFSLNDEPRVSRLGGPSVPSILLVCNVCSHEVLFNAIVLGLGDLFIQPVEVLPQPQPAEGVGSAADASAESVPNG